MFAYPTGTGADFRFGIWDGTAWDLLPGAVPNEGTSLNLREAVFADLGQGRGLYFGGFFQVAGGVSASNFALLDEVCSPQQGTPYCTSFAGVSGVPATCRATGSSSVTANNLELQLAGAAPQSFGLFAFGTARQLGVVGSGALCIGGALERILPPGLTSPQGSLSLSIDLTQPYAAGALPGSSLNVQAFFRDTGPSGAVLGSSDALSIVFVP